MKALSYLAVLCTVLYSANALNTWCCYVSVHSLAGWIRVFATPANPAMASKVCAAEGGKLAPAGEDYFRVELLKLIQSKNLTIYGGVVRMPDRNTVVDQHRALKPDGTFFNINANDKYPFACFREIKNFQINSCGPISLGYELNTKINNCYKFHNQLVQWNKANDTCNDEGAHLAVINSDDEAQVIKELYAKYPADKIPVPSSLSVGQYLKDYAFLGVTKVGKEWMTNDLKELSQAGYAKFAPGEPNNARGDENCLAASREGLLVDEPCDRSKPFVCEKLKDAQLCQDFREMAKCDKEPLPAV